MPTEKIQSNECDQLYTGIVSVSSMGKNYREHRVEGDRRIRVPDLLFYSMTLNVFSPCRVLGFN